MKVKERFLQEIIPVEKQLIESILKKWQGEKRIYLNEKQKKMLNELKEQK